MHETDLGLPLNISFSLSDALDEDRIWRKQIAPALDGLADNVFRALQYSFCEMMNNAIEHSDGNTINVEVKSQADKIVFIISDDGVGIFNKIKNALDLDESKDAILELAKGKFTSDESAHSGEGIFFTSRICDDFAIFSNHLVFFGNENDCELQKIVDSKNLNDTTLGTVVCFAISQNSTVSIKNIFDEYANPDAQPSFFRTRIPVKLMEYERSILVSRSQGKRLVNRFDRFLEVILDFSDVEEIGQGFADEVFRVWQKAHPQIKLVTVNCNDAVASMIKHVQNVL